MKFRNKKELELPTSRVSYPVGTFLSTPKGYFYVRGENSLLKLISKRVLESYAPRVVKTSNEAIAGYKVKGRLKFRNGSLIYSISDGKMYLVESGKKRRVTSPDVLSRLQVKFSDFVWVSIPELNLQETGDDLA